MADVLVLHFENGSHGKIVHLLIRSTTNDEITPDIKILLLGDTQSGKSTLVFLNFDFNTQNLSIDWCIVIKTIG